MIVLRGMLRTLSRPTKWAGGQVNRKFPIAGAQDISKPVIQDAPLTRAYLHGWRPIAAMLEIVMIDRTTKHNAIKH